MSLNLAAEYQALRNERDAALARVTELTDKYEAALEWRRTEMGMLEAQLAEARAENERLKAEVAGHFAPCAACEAIPFIGCRAHDWVDNLIHERDGLRTERDQARAEVERLKASLLAFAVLGPQEHALCQAILDRAALEGK